LISRRAAICLTGYRAFRISGSIGSGSGCGFIRRGRCAGVVGYPPGGRHRHSIGAADGQRGLFGESWPAIRESKNKARGRPQHFIGTE